MGKQVTLFVTLYVKPEDAERFKTVHRPLWAACAAERECLFFDVFQDPERPGRFRFVEVWDGNREWFEKHQMTKDYYRILWEESKPLWTQDFEIEFFEREGEGGIVRQGYLNDSEKMD